MNDRVVKNPTFKNNGDFHRSLAARPAGTKDWLNTHTEVEHLGNGKFAASIGVGHRIFFDKADGNKPKKHKLTDERATKDYVLIQGVRCCVEIHPYYAKFFDIQHEEVRVEEERWVIQRLFKEPDTWRDVDAYNPQIAVEEYSEPAGDVVKVAVTYDTDYGLLTIEYFQRDGHALKHNVSFKNTSGSTETFRVLQRWAGISADKFAVDGIEAALNKEQKGSYFTFNDRDNLTKIIENPTGLATVDLADFLEVLTGSRSPAAREVFDEGGIRLAVQDQLHASLWIDNHLAMESREEELSIMVKAIQECPNDARVFIGGLGLGFILWLLAHSHKAREIVVSEIDDRVINKFAPIISGWFAKYCPNCTLEIIHGDARTEVSKHGDFDWIFMDFFYKQGEITPESESELEELSSPNLSERGKYTTYSSPNLRQAPFETLRFKPVEVTNDVEGLKGDFIYDCWILAHNEVLEIDPDTATLNNPTEDGHLLSQGLDPDYGQARIDCLVPEGLTKYTGGATLPLGGKAYDGGRGDMYSQDFRSYIEWDISSISGGTLTANPIFKYDGQDTVATDEEINPITEEAPSGATDANLRGYIASGVAYVDPFPLAAGDNQSQDLGATAKADLQTAMTAAQSWFAIGLISPADNCPGSPQELISSIISEDGAATPPPTLYVEYTPAPAVGLENKSANMGSKMVAGGLI